MSNTIDNLRPVRWVSTHRAGRTTSLFGALRAWISRRLLRPEWDDALVGLDARTLADIGAPDQLIASAMAQRELQHREHERLRVELGSGAWRRW